MSARSFPASTALCLLLLSSFALGQGRAPRSPGSASQPIQGRAPSMSRSTGGTNSQSANDEGKLEFRTESILVQVPVIVLDKQGKHVRGLTKEDFKVLENGKEQSVSAFEELASTPGALPSVALKPGQFGNLTLSDQQPRTVTIVALDTVNTPFLDQTYGRRELVKYLANSMESGQVLALMIITSHGVKIIQGLTGDSAQLIQTLKKVSGELPALQSVDIDAQADAATGDIPDIPAPGGDPDAAMQTFIERGDAIYAQFQQQNAIETTMQAFLGIAWTLSGVPGRKSLIWATGGFPFNLYSPDIVPNGNLASLYERTMQALNQAQIAVYPVDVRGLVNTSPLGDASKAGVPTNRQMMNRSWLQQSTIDSLNEFADMTGGKAFYNTNDLATSFKRAGDDASSYYMLGYYMDSHNNKAGWRQLKVKLDKKDVEVRARKGFFVTNVTIHAQLSKNTDMVYALTSPIEATGVPVVVQWAGSETSGDKKKVSFLAHMPANALTFDPTAPDKVDFDFAAIAFSQKDGKEAARSGIAFSKPIPPDQLASVKANGVAFRNMLELPAGSYNVRFVVRDNITGKMGSVTAPLTVN